MFHAEVASRMSEMWSQTMVMPAVHPMAELVLLAEADGCDPERAIVLDTGARRSVIRDPACFDRLTCRPAPFKIRGVLGASGQPDFMGTATVYLPVSPTELGEHTLVEAVTLVDAVCIPACPHDIIAIGSLLWSGASLWLAPGKGLSWLRLGSGSYVRLYNRAIIFANACASKGASVVAVATDGALPHHPPPIETGVVGRKRAFYICSGELGNPTGFAAWWNHVSGGGVCDEFDKINATGGDMLLNSSFAPVYTDVRDGVYHAGLLTPPCGQFNPRRIAFPDERYPVLRSVVDFGMGVAGLSDRFQRAHVLVWDARTEVPHFHVPSVHAPGSAVRPGHQVRTRCARVSGRWIRCERQTSRGRDWGAPGWALRAARTRMLCARRAVPDFAVAVVRCPGCAGYG